MFKHVAAGVAAGAVGTMALDIATYIDMTAAGRKPSDVPAQVVEKLAANAGVAQLSTPDDRADEKTKNRKSSIGSLLGYGVGLSIGGVYGLLRPKMRFIPVPLFGIALGAAAMAASDVPATKLNVTDPSTWSKSAWMSDIVPHLVYGIVTAIAFESFA